MATTYRALLIANSYFPNDPQTLIELEGPKKDPLVLNNALCDREVGLFEETNVRILVERPRSVMCSELVKFFRAMQRDDVAFLFYSGHGVLDEYNRLFLCAQDSEADLGLLEATAVSAEWINRLIDDSPVQTCIVVLDCCHAGAFFKGGDLNSNFRGRGRYAVMSSRSGELVRDATQNGTSYFTEYFSRALRTVPDLDADGYVGLSEVYAETRARLVEEQKKRPTIGWRGENDVLVARRAASQSPAEPITAAIRRPDRRPLRETMSPPQDRRHNKTLLTRKRAVVAVAVALVVAIAGIAAGLGLTHGRGQPKVIPLLVASGRNMLNSGTSSGPNAGWRSEYGHLDSHPTGKAPYLAIHSSDVSVYRDVKVSSPLAPSYVATAWLSSPSGQATGMLCIGAPDYSAVDRNCVSYTVHRDFKPFQVVSAQPPTNSYFRFQVRPSTGTTDMYIDKARLDPSMLQSGSFEGGLTGWTRSEHTFVSLYPNKQNDQVVNEKANDGKSFFAFQTHVTNSDVQQDVEIKGQPAPPYLATAWLSAQPTPTGATTTATGKLCLWGQGTRPQNCKTYKVTTQHYLAYQISDSDAGSAELHFAVLPAPNGGTTEMDTVSLVH